MKVRIKRVIITFNLLASFFRSSSGSSEEKRN